MAVLYFRAETASVVHFLAAVDDVAAREFFNKISADPALEQITAEDAERCAPHFSEFAAKGTLCPDGTYSLGVVEKAASRPQLQGGPYFRH